MKIDLSEFKKNIISWYPIKKDQKVLEVMPEKEITEELKKCNFNR